MPIVGTVYVALAQQRPLKIAELVEAEQRMIAGAAKVAVVRRAFLGPVGLTDRTIQIQNQVANRFALPYAVNPFARQVRKGIDMLWSSQNFGLEPPHVAPGSRVAPFCSPANNVSHGGIHTQPFGVVRVFIASQATEHGLT